MTVKIELSNTYGPVDTRCCKLDDMLQTLTQLMQDQGGMLFFGDKIVIERAM